MQALLPRRSCRRRLARLGILDTFLESEWAESQVSSGGLASDLILLNSLQKRVLFAVFFVLPHY